MIVGLLNSCAVIFSCKDMAVNLSVYPQAFLPLWVADMDFKLPEEILADFHKRIDHGIFGYTDPDQEYYDALDRWFAVRLGYHVEPETVTVGCGVVYGLATGVKAFTKAGDSILIQQPVYYPFREVIEDNGRIFVNNQLHYEDGKYTIDFDDLAKKAADEKTTLFILCNPHNPSGRIWTEEELKKMAEIIEKNNMWVISELAEKTILCTAPSKTFNLAGMMISNVIIRDEGLKEIWLGRHYNFDNPLSIAAAQAAYEKGEPWLEELRAYLDENFRFTGEYLKERLPKAKYRVSEATYLAWVDLNAYFEPDEHLPLFFAYKAGVLLEGGNMFVQNSDGFIRLNLACPKATLAEGLRRICEAVNTKHTEKYLGEK